MSGSLAHSPADIIRELLIDLSLGVTPAVGATWPVYAASVPDKPDSLITITDTAGVLDGRNQVDGEVQEHHGFQTAVRCANHSDGYVKAETIAIAFDESVRLNTVTIGSIQYTVYAVSRKSGVIAVGTGPGDKRHLFTINAVVALRQVA